MMRSATESPLYPTFIPMPEDIDESALSKPFLTPAEIDDWVRSDPEPVVPVDYEALALENVVNAARRGDAQEIQKAVELLDTLRGLPEAVGES